jgi:hypothetical protein
MKLSPKARRFVAEAIRDLPTAIARNPLRSWVTWVEGTGEAEMPPEIASLTLTALQRFETWMRECLEANRANEDKEAELINDIRFVQSIEKALQREGVHAAPV